MNVVTITTVTEDDLPDLLPLVRGYCEFYEVAPSDQRLLALSRSLLADPALEGEQLIARRGSDAIGFATLYWTWSTLQAGRIGVMNDLFVAPEARGSGAADALILACRDRCRARGAVALGWQTAVDNERAQKVYDRVGGERSQWIDYGLAV